MKKVTILILSFASALCIHAQNTQDFKSIYEKARKEMDASRQAFQDSADKALDDYLKAEAQMLDEYKQYCEELKQTWGDSEIVESTRKKWVDYSGDKKSRTQVDWETGKVTIEVLADPGDSEEAIREKMKKAVSDLLASRGNASGFDLTSKKKSPVSDRPLLDGQIDLSRYGVTSLSGTEAPKPFSGQGGTRPAPSRGGKLDLSRSQRSSSGSDGKTMVEASADKKKTEEAQAQAEVQAQAEAEAEAKAKAEARAKEQEAIAKLPDTIVDSEKPVVETVKTSEGTKKVVSITLELVEDHIPKRAEKFKEIISRHSATYSVDEPLIYAIMEQESAFNPMAQSWVPAYGLMQLVPKSGGRDAYRYVHKKDAIPSADFLFDPNNNIQLGTGYLKLLMSTTFKNVQDTRCRMLCAIAAYNTGAGNVSRSINGTTNISKAIPTINSMSYDQLFEHLKKSLPHAETKDYIQKVTSKMTKYIK